MRITNKELRRKIRNLLLREGRKAETAARRALADMGNNSPTDEEVKELAKRYETQGLATMLQRKQSYASSHRLTKRILSENDPGGLDAISSFLRRYSRPASFSSAMSAPFAGLQSKTYPAGTGYPFSKDSADPTAKANYDLIRTAAGATPTSNQEFADCALNSAAITQHSAAQPMPDETGSKLEIGLAALLAHIDPDNRIYVGRLDSAPGQDLFRIGDDIVFESKYSKQTGGEINDNFGASQPGATSTNKYYVFLSSNRSYFINSPILAGQGTAGSDVAPLDTTAAANLQSNVRLKEYMFDQTRLRDTMIDILRVYANRVTVPVQIGGSNPRTERRPKSGADLARSIQQGLTTAGTAEDPPLIRSLIQATIDAINASPTKDVLIESIRYISAINEVEIERSITVPQSGPVGVGGALFDADLNAAYAAFNREMLDSSGNIRDYGYITATAPNALGRSVTKTFTSLVSYLIYAWNLKDTVDSAKIGQDFIATAAEGGKKAYGAQEAEIKSGQNINQKLKATNRAPSVKANDIFNLINNPAVLNDQQKQNLINQLKGLGSFNAANPNLKEVADEIRNDPRAILEALREIMRGSTGRYLVFRDYLRPLYAQAIDNLVRKTSGTQSALEQQIASNPEMQKLFSDRGINIERRMGRMLSQQIASNWNNIEEYIRNNENDFWTSFDREAAAHFDKQLYNLFFAPAQTVSKPHVEAALAADSDLQNYQTALSDAVTAFVNDFTSQGLTRIADKETSAEYNYIFKTYRATLDPSELAQFETKNELEQFEEIKTSGHITPEQIARISKYAPSKEDAEYDAYLDSPFSIYSESRIYENILKKILYTAKKRR